jgi:hypothetical protein
MQGRKGAVQNVINAVVKTRFFNGSDIRGLFYHTNQALISGGAGAVAARINVSDVAAYGTKMKFFFEIADGRSQIVCILGAGAQNVKCQTLSAFAANARKFL